MITKVQKWGNSLAVRLPKNIVQSARLSSGNAVTMELLDDKIVIVPVRRQYKLDELLKGVTSKNRHTEADTGTAVGKEVW